MAEFWILEIKQAIVTNEHLMILKLNIFLDKIGIIKPNIRCLLFNKFWIVSNYMVCSFITLVVSKSCVFNVKQILTLIWNCPSSDISKVAFKKWVKDFNSWIARRIDRSSLISNTPFEGWVINEKIWIIDINVAT